MGFGSLALLGTSVSAQLNFAVLGNWGTGTWQQRAVSDKLSDYCDKTNCSFIVSPGSNFGNGVQRIYDSTFSEQFVDIYGAKYKLPFYTVLGVDDWRGNVTAQAVWSQLQFGKAKDEDQTVKSQMGIYKEMELEDKNIKAPLTQREIASYKAPKFVLPNWYWSQAVNYSEASDNAVFGAGDKTAMFIYFDTYILSEHFVDEGVRQDAWNNLKATLAAANGAFDWIIAVGDTSIYSSGKIGGNKEMEFNLRPLLKEYGVDAYISGSDFDMEIMEDGTMAMLNCGNGSYGRGKGLWTAPGSIAFSSASGFCSVKLSKNMMTLNLVDGASGEIVASSEHKRQEKSINVFAKGQAMGNVPKVVYTPLPWGVGGSVGPNGEGTLISPAIINFIKIVGSIGLACTGFVAFIATITSANRFQKVMNA